MATLCPAPAVGRGARATEKQKSLYSQSSARSKTMFGECRTATQVSAMLDNVPPGSIFQVFATKQKGVTAIELEGSRGLCYVLGNTLSSILPLPLSLTLTLTLILTLTVKHEDFF